jgi:hypothetical protein
MGRHYEGYMQIDISILISIYLRIAQGVYCGSYKRIRIFEVTCLGPVTISE